MTIAIIPARIGSKRVPKKNIKLFNGKPLITYVIEIAKQSGLFEKIIVSTDSEEIAQIASIAGADVPFLRPKHLADDYTSTMSVMNHAVTWLKENNFLMEYVCCLYATAVLLNHQDLLKAYQLLQDSQVDYVFSIMQYQHPIQRAFTLSENNQIILPSLSFQGHRTQDLEKHYYDAGQFYWGKSVAFLEEKAMFSRNSRGYIINGSSVVDIDTIEDFNLAESLYKTRQKNEC